MGKLPRAHARQDIQDILDHLSKIIKVALKEPAQERVSEKDVVFFFVLDLHAG